jgi:hypothetical protein
MLCGRCDGLQVLSTWGANLLSMPHMIYLDNWGFVWIIDVGLHQVSSAGGGTHTVCLRLRDTSIGLKGY